jgi:two-component system OmpR family sensor kinase
MKTWLVRGLVAVLLVAHGMVLLLLLKPDRIYAHAAQVADLATYAVMLGAAALLYVYFRLGPEDGTASLATAAIFGTTQGIGYAALRLMLDDEVAARPGWLVLTQVGVAAVLVGLLAAQRLLRDVVAPLLVGLSLGVVVTTGRLVLLDRVAPSRTLEDAMPLMATVLLGLYLAMALLLVRVVWLPTWASRRLAAVVVLLGLNQLLTYPVVHDDGRSVLAVALSVVGSALLVVTSVDLVRAALARQDESERHLDALEARARKDRTVLHEVAGTVAGISAASRLLSSRAGLGAAERRQLHTLLDAESARVARLITSSRGGVSHVDLDPLISTVLLTQGVRGRLVAWRPSGHRVRARVDDLVETLHLLIDNAAVHSGGSTLEVVVQSRDDQVTIAVVDDGRGIPPEVAPNVLEWGARAGSRVVRASGSRRPAGWSAAWTVGSPSSRRTGWGRGSP